MYLFLLVLQMNVRKLSTRCRRLFMKWSLSSENHCRATFRVPRLSHHHRRFSHPLSVCSLFLHNIYWWPVLLEHGSVCPLVPLLTLSPLWRLGLSYLWLLHGQFWGTGQCKMCGFLQAINHWIPHFFLRLYKKMTLMFFKRMVLWHFVMQIDLYLKFEYHKKMSLGNYAFVFD